MHEKQQYKGHFGAGDTQGNRHIKEPEINIRNADRYPSQYQENYQDSTKLSVAEYMMIFVFIHVIRLQGKSIESKSYFYSTR